MKYPEWVSNCHLAEPGGTAGMGPRANIEPVGRDVRFSPISDISCDENVRGGSSIADEIICADTAEIGPATSSSSDYVLGRRLILITESVCSAVAIIITGGKHDHQCHNE